MGRTDTNDGRKSHSKKSSAGRRGGHRSRNTRTGTGVRLGPRTHLNRDRVESEDVHQMFRESVRAGVPEYSTYNETSRISYCLTPSLFSPLNRFW